MTSFEKQSQLKFDARLDSKDGKDVHRQFKGSCFVVDGSIAVVEVQVSASRRVVVQVLLDRAVHQRPDGSGPYTLDDIHVGSRLTLGGQTFVITKVDGQNVDFMDELNVGERAVDAISDKRLQELRDKMRAKIKERGAETIVGLGRHFRILDDNGDRTVDQREFSKALREYGFAVSDQEIQLLMRLYDLNGDGKLDYEEFLRGVRGEMNEFRKGLVQRAFTKLDANKSGAIQLDDVKLFYNARGHPDVIARKKKEEDVLTEWLANFELDESTRDGSVSYEEFLTYYNSISCSIDNDEHFRELLQKAWSL